MQMSIWILRAGFQVCMSVSVHLTGSDSEARESIGFPGFGVSGCCESDDVGVWN